MRSILIILFFTLFALPAKSQKWFPGSFTDTKGNTVSGLINPTPSGRGPVKGEGFIEFRDDKKTSPYKLSASDIQCFRIGADSFVVAHAPHNETWSKKELDFVKVELDEQPKLYAAVAGIAGEGGGNGFGIQPVGGFGLGTGGYGAAGGGLAINIGGGGKGYMSKSQLMYFYGDNTANMEHLTAANFVDVMSDIMGDQPEIVDKIRSGVYQLANIRKLIADFKRAKASER